jgi:hypothetical protein
VKGTNSVFAHRQSRVNLVQRTATEFASDVRGRFAAEEETLEECLTSFKRMIQDKSASGQTSVRQREQMAEKNFNWRFADSLTETFTELLIDLSSFIDIDLSLYPGILDSRRQSYLARLLRLASRIGLTSAQVKSLRFENSEIPPEEKLEKIETQIELVLKSPQDQAWAVSVSCLYKLLGSPFPTFHGSLYPLALLTLNRNCSFLFTRCLTSPRS